ncbi:MAG TPA: hypothetical protein VFV73_02070 [Streptosporangiaceae bacterium]|nr:hypothetical protein [Streptosporangiaceae bacterium]
MRDHVVYESRLELARLIFADFDRAVHRILAQPFLLKAKVDGKIRKHVPDYFLVTDRGPVVIDVTPTRRPNWVSVSVLSSAGCRVSSGTARQGWSAAISSRSGKARRSMTGGWKPRWR